MLPKYHIFFGLIFSIVLFFIFPSIGIIGMGLIFLSSFLIDVDHYIFYILKNKDIGLKNAVNYFLEKRKIMKKMSLKEKSKFYSGFCFLHGIESLIILFIAGIFISKYFLFICFGFTLHLFLDVSEEIYSHFRLDKISIIYDWFKFKRLKLLE